MSASVLRSGRWVRSGVAGLVGALLAVVSLVVLAGPAEAAHAAPWRWKRVSSSAVVEPGSQEDVVLYCPAGYVPVSLEWSGGRKLERQAEYVDYSGNWGELKVFNHTTTGVTMATSLNCVLGADVGAITTASVTLARSFTRSGGFVDCPSGWGPLSFGADWEGFSTNRRIDFTAPTATGWFATGYGPETNTHLYLEVHCASNAALAGATLVETAATWASAPQVRVVCPSGKRVVNGGAFEYPMEGALDPMQGLGTTQAASQAQPSAGGVGSFTAEATMPPPSSATWLVGRALCVPYSVPVLTVTAHPSGEQHVRTISYAFTATDPAGEPLTYTCSVDGSSSPCTPGATNTVSNLTVGSHTLDLEVRNESSQPDSEQYAFSITMAPDAPSVTGSTPGSGDVEVAFAAGSSNGGSAITGYTAECASTDGGATNTAGGSVSPIHVPGLTDGHHYHCRVKATNAVGDSSFSAYGATVLVAGAPAAATVTGSTASAGAVSVTFTPGGDGGSPVSGFTVECVSTDGGSTSTATGPASPVSVSGLTNGKHYQCRVRATNPVGTSPFSGFGPTVLLPTPPGRTVVTKSKAVSAKTIAVTLLVADDGGSPVTALEVSCTSSNGGRARSAKGSGSTLKVGKLTPGKRYRCRARAHNAVGVGPWGANGPKTTVAGGGHHRTQLPARVPRVVVPA